MTLGGSSGLAPVRLDGADSTAGEPGGGGGTAANAGRGAVTAGTAVATAEAAAATPSAAVTLLARRLVLDTGFTCHPAPDVPQGLMIIGTCLPTGPHSGLPASNLTPAGHCDDRAGPGGPCGRRAPGGSRRCAQPRRAGRGRLIAARTARPARPVPGAGHLAGLGDLAIAILTMTGALTTTWAAGIAAA